MGGRGKVIDVSSLVSAINHTDLSDLTVDFSKSMAEDLDYDSFLRNLLNIIVNVIPIAESRYRQSPTDRNAKALSDLVNIAHVILKDIYMSYSYEEIVSRVDREVLQLMQREMLSSVTVELSDFNKRLSNLVSKKSLKEAIDRMMEELVMSLGISLRNSYSNALTKVRDIFTGGWDGSRRKKSRTKGRGPDGIVGGL